MPDILDVFFISMHHHILLHCSVWKPQKKFWNWTRQQNESESRKVMYFRSKNGIGLFFHMTQLTSRSTIKAIACSKPTISEHLSKWKHSGTIADQCKQRGALCHIIALFQFFIIFEMVSVVSAILQSTVKKNFLADKSQIQETIWNVWKWK